MSERLKSELGAINSSMASRTLPSSFQSCELRRPSMFTWRRKSGTERARCEIKRRRTTERARPSEYCEPRAQIDALPLLNCRHTLIQPRTYNCAIDTHVFIANDVNTLDANSAGNCDDPSSSRADRRSAATDNGYARRLKKKEKPLRSSHMNSACIKASAESRSAKCRRTTATCDKNQDDGARGPKCCKTCEG